MTIQKTTDRFKKKRKRHFYHDIPLCGIWAPSPLLVSMVTMKMTNIGSCLFVNFFVSFWFVCGYYFLLFFVWLFFVLFLGVFFLFLDNDIKFCYMKGRWARRALIDRRLCLCLTRSNRRMSLSNRILSFFFTVLNRVLIIRIYYSSGYVPWNLIMNYFL